MTSNVYCSMIHGGLNIDIKERPFIQHCCLRREKIFIEPDEPLWNNKLLAPLREKNLRGEWDQGCLNCKKLEQLGSVSFRQGMNHGLEIYGQTNLSGPARIDIMFDISCNLACRTCNPGASTFWQKHLKDHNRWTEPIFTTRQKDEVIELLSKLNLENLRQVVFCGGETLMGNEYWGVARWLSKNVPNAKEQLTICFQTNGTQSISSKNFDVIEKIQLLKLHVSIDGVGPQFEYMRWPASWTQVQENLFELRETLPSNAMFLVEQTISIFNVLDIDCVDQWVKTHFSANREGDAVDCTRHLAQGIFNLNNSTKELVEKMQANDTKHLISPGWIERPGNVQEMVQEIKRFDGYRNQSFKEVFPETASAFSRYW